MLNNVNKVVDTNAHSVNITPIEQHNAAQERRKQNDNQA